METGIIVNKSGRRPRTGTIRLDIYSVRACTTARNLSCAALLIWHKRARADAFVLSINDLPGARELFVRFDLEAVQTTYKVSGGGGRRMGKLLVHGG